MHISHRISENLERLVSMGGYGSGRSGGRPTVESGLTLDLSRIFKTGWLKPGATTRGVLRWTNVRTSQETASMGFEAQLGENYGSIRLNWTSTNLLSGEKRQCENSIALTTTPQPFGGRRWWFVCPRTGRHVVRLHVPPGASVFACRAAHGLAHRSQRETASDRAFSRAFALRWKLGDTGRIGGYIAKPKGMHRRTFERAMDRIDRAEAIVTTHMAAWLDPFQAERVLERAAKKE
jgi:hypothetical protein